MKTISIAKDFTEFPGLRNCTISDFSGEEFYHKILNIEFKEVYESKATLYVDLDFTDGYASSFLDEAFGNLVYDFTLDVVKKHILIISNQEPHWKEMIEEKSFLQWEERRKKKESPKVTVNHAAWYRLENNVLILKVWAHPAE